jgi:uncharacterized phage protein gp47/JayE
VLPSRADLFASYRLSLQTAGNLSRLNPAVVDIAGSDLNLLAGATSLMGEEISAQLAQCLLDSFSDTAQADALDRLAGDRYGLTRLGATPSTVDLTFTRATDAGGAGVIPAGTRVQTATGTQFATDADLAFGATDLTQSVTATALIVGPDSNIAPLQITTIVDAAFDSSLAVSNPSWSAGGTDPETDPAFRGRIRAFFATLRRGTLGAIQFGALGVAGVSVATAIEIDNSASGDPAGAVQLIIADANGNASGSMITQVIDAELLWRAGGIPVFVTGGTVVFQPITWALDIDSGFSQQTVLSQVAAVTVAVAQFLAAGDTLHRSTLIAAAHTVPGAIITDSSLVNPIVDVVPLTTSTILRVRSTDITFASS